MFFSRSTVHIWVVSMVIVFNSIPPVQSQDVYWSKAFADAIIDRHSDINNLTGKGWEYSNSIVLIGIEKLYYETGNDKYLNYIKKYVDTYVDNGGNISFNSADNNLDHLHPGWLLITLYEETGLEKYKLAADNIRAEFDNQPRNPSGGFWHKQRYPNQMWADGIYMAEPFLIRYGVLFDDLEYTASEATQQAILIADHAYDSSDNLILHGWDETKSASWADPVTGNSPEVWSRGMGWYCMALVDILDYLPGSHPNYNRMVEILDGLAKGIKDFQDPATGLWYQVVNKADSAGNWHETSGSAMFVYSLKKAIDNNYIDSATYMPVVQKGWEGLQSKITLDSKNQPVINDFVRGMGIKDNYAMYISQSKVSTPTSKYPHGYCGVLLASSVMEFPLPPFYELTTSISGEGAISFSPEQDDYISGTEIELTANPDDNWEFMEWTGDLNSIQNPLTIAMDSNISIRAVFEEKLSSVDTKTKIIYKGVYPRIAENEVHLKIEENISSLSWNIFNTAGQLVKTSLRGIDTTIKVSELPAGIYSISIIIDNHYYQDRFIRL